MPWPANSIRAVVWDWNGTLLDDVDAGMATTNQVLAEFDRPELVDRQAYRAGFGFPIRDFYTRIGFVTDEHFRVASRRYVELFPGHLAQVRLQAHAVEVLGAVRERGLAQVLISATVTAALHRQLEPHPVRVLLDEVLGCDDALNPSKQAVVAGWLERQPWRPDQVLMVGDTNHDHEIAEALGTRFVHFTGGHQTHDHASRIDDLRQVLDLL